ncbi:unnamed protein product [Meganyctiphanes norvegica]|uniref:ZNF451 PIN-like domain-containing protein n=1 Tax=Meganyctiphanes norvegica TaxID=48144 RepID=A0AAV2RSL4_MEGNR
MVDCALDDAFFVVGEVLKIVDSRFGEHGKTEIDENLLFAEAEKKLYSGYNTKEVIQVLASSFINKLKSKTNCSKSEYNSDILSSHLQTPVSLSSVSKHTELVVNEQNKKKNIQHVSGATISDHIRKMVSKKVKDSEAINKDITNKPNENPMKFSISSHIQKVVQEKIKNKETYTVIQRSSKPSALVQMQTDRLKNNRKIFQGNQKFGKVNETSRYIGNIPKDIKETYCDSDIIDLSDVCYKSVINKKSNPSNKGKCFDSRYQELPTIIDITNPTQMCTTRKVHKTNMDQIFFNLSDKESTDDTLLQTQSKNMKNNNISCDRSKKDKEELLNARKNIKDTEPKELQNNIRLVNSIGTISTPQSETSTSNQYSTLDDMNVDEFTQLICRLFPHLCKEDISKMVKRFNKPHHKLMVLNTYISNSEEEGMTIPEEAYRYVSSKKSTKRKSECEIEDINKCLKLDKDSGFTSSSHSKCNTGFIDSSIYNDLSLKETINEKKDESSEKLKKSLKPCKSPNLNYSTEIKSKSLHIVQTFSRSTNKIRKEFIEEKTQFLCNVLNNANKEQLRVQVEYCYTNEDVQELLINLLEKENFSEKDKHKHMPNVNSSKTLSEAVTSTSKAVLGKNIIPLGNKFNPGISKSITKNEVFILPVTPIESVEVKCTENESIISNQVMQLKDIFTDADPKYLLKWCRTIKGDQEKLQQLVDEMLDKRDYPKCKNENELITNPNMNETNKERCEKNLRNAHTPQPNISNSNSSQSLRVRKTQNDPPGLEKMKHIIFVDLDNWHNFFQKLMRPLPDFTFVWGFHGGASQWREPIRCQNFNRCKAKKQFYLQEKCSNRKDAADFAICLKVGRMDVRLAEEIAFTVLSGDKGFFEIERQMMESDRRVVVINPHHKAPDELQLLLESVGDA